VSVLIVTPNEVLLHLNKTDAIAHTLAAVFEHCAGLSADQRTAWSDFLDDYGAYSAKQRKAWGNAFLNAIMFTNTTTQIDLHNIESKLDDYERKLGDWEVIAQNKCGFDAPPNTPPDPPPSATSKTIERALIAGAVITTGVVGLVGWSYLRRFL
jgi:hypothetical protein